MFSHEAKRALLNRVGLVLERHVEVLFKPGTKLTLLARTPGNDEADVIVTCDDMDELSALIERGKQREAILPTPPTNTKEAGNA